jgi:hypothetical protein
MGYRAMQGDYYVGDPFFGAIVPAIAGLAGRLFGRSKQPAGAIMRAAAPAISMAGRAGAIARQAGADIATAVRTHPGTAAGVAAASGAGMAALATREMMVPGMPAGLGPRGFHMSKPHRRYQVYPTPPHLVRNRRMRVTNVKALRRAIRRASGFSRIARRVLHFTSPRPPRGRPYFKSRKRTRRV